MGGGGGGTGQHRRYNGIRIVFSTIFLSLIEVVEWLKLL